MTYSNESEETSCGCLELFVRPSSASTATPANAAICSERFRTPWSAPKSDDLRELRRRDCLFRANAKALDIPHPILADQAAGAQNQVRPGFAVDEPMLHGDLLVLGG